MRASGVWFGIAVLFVTACSEAAREPDPTDPDVQEPTAPQAPMKRDGAAGGRGGADGGAGAGGAGGREPAPDGAAPPDAATTGVKDGPGTDAAGRDAAAGRDGAQFADARPTVDPSDELFDPTKLPRFDLTIAPEAMAVIGRADACDPKVMRPWVKATFKYGEEVVPDVGVHLKGEASCRPMSKKAAFKIKFDEFVKDQSFRGLRKLTLNNMMEDPTFVAERLSYLVYRSAGLPAPRANSALVYVNGAFYGVYVNLETEDKTFLKRWFGSNDGNLYEEVGKDLLPGNENAFQLETNETKNDRADLRGLIAAIAAAPAATYPAGLDAVLDTGHYLKFTALEALVNQWDMYSYTYYWPNNFRLYHDPTTKKFTFLPWGMDMTMKAREAGAQPEKHLPLFALAMPAGIVFKKCVASSACKEAYKKVVSEMLKVYEGLDLLAVAARYYQQVRPHVLVETRKEVTNGEFERHYGELQRTIREKPAFVRAELAR